MWFLIVEESAGQYVRQKSQGCSSKDEIKILLGFYRPTVANGVNWEEIIG